MQMLIGANNYKLILLDTNAIREIVTNTNMSGKWFLEKFFENVAKKTTLMGNNKDEVKSFSSIAMDWENKVNEKFYRTQKKIQL